MIEVKDLKKSYGDVEALRGISFTVPKGQILGFLGPNGAGKTTAMKIITGFMAATDGTVVVDGADVHEDSMAVRQKIGYLPENAPLYQDMIVLDYLVYVSRVRGIPTKEQHAKIVKMSAICGLQGVLQKQISSLSKGYRQRVGLAQAMIHDPEILILDEPTSGLDPNQIVEIRNLIREIGRERTIILSTHNLPEVLATCNRLVIIHRGAIVADGTPTELEKKNQAAPRVVVHVQKNGHDPAALEKKLASVSGVEEVTAIEVAASDALGFELTTSVKRDVRPDLFDLCKDEGLGLLELRRDVIDLEGLFRRLTSN